MFYILLYFFTKTRIIKNTRRRVHKFTTKTRAIKDTRRCVHKYTTKTRVIKDTRRRVHKYTTKTRVVKDTRRRAHKSTIEVYSNLSERIVQIEPTNDNFDKRKKIISIKQRTVMTLYMGNTVINNKNDYS